MTTLATLERKLLRLSAVDRRWILEQLASTDADDAAHIAFERTLDRVALQSALPEVVATVLARESAWIGAVVLEGAEARWRRSVLKALPRNLQRAITAAGRRGLRVSTPISNAARDGVARAVAAIGPIR